MYPDVSQEQLASYSDTICIICREEMSNAGGNTENALPQQIKKLPCDHIFHKNCLRSWFQRQQTCPTCRTPILRLLQTTTPNAAPAAPAAAAPVGVQQAPVHAQPIPNPNHQRSAPTNTQHHGTNSASHFSAHTFQHNQAHQQATNLLGQNMNLPTNFAGANMPLPPFAFMPPPLPPLNLSPTLTIEELAEMEGNERHNVEARIHCLRNINTLLTASMVNIQQYMNICAANSHLDNLTQNKKDSTSIENDLKHVSSGTQPSSSATASDALTSKSRELHQKVENLSSKIEELNKKSEVLIAEATSTTSATDTVFDTPREAAAADMNASVEETDEVRKRRLQHFNASSPIQD